MSGCSRMNFSASGVSTRRPKATEVLMRSCPRTVLCSSAARLSVSSSSRWMALHSILVVERADLGRAHAAGVAVEQPARRAGLQRGDVLGRRRLVMPRSDEALLKLPVSTMRANS